MGYVLGWNQPGDSSIARTSCHRKAFDLPHPQRGCGLRREFGPLVRRLELGHVLKMKQWVKNLIYSRIRVFFCVEPSIHTLINLNLGYIYIYVYIIFTARLLIIGGPMLVDSQGSCPSAP